MKLVREFGGMLPKNIVLNSFGVYLIDILTLKSINLYKNVYIKDVDGAMHFIYSHHINIIQTR